jgi:anti-repressor protein
MLDVFDETPVTNIQVFNNEQFGSIRTTGTADEPLFCAADVCKALGYTNGRKAIADHCDTPDVTKRDVGVVTGKKADGSDAIQMVEMSFVNESGLYSLIFGSKLEQAKCFKHWVTKEVLPSIRKHGAYATTQTIDSIIANPDNAIKLLTALKESNERAAREREQRLAAEGQVAELEKKDIENKPKVVYADAVAGSNSSCLIGEMAKMIAQNGYPIGEKRLFQWLRDNHYLCSYGERFNQPYQQYIEQGLFTMKQSVYSVNGEMRTRNTTKITGKGQIYFINKFIAK